MQKFCISSLTLTKSGCKTSAELHFAKLLAKTTSLNLSQNAGRINEQPLKTSGFNVLSSRENSRKPQRGGQLAPPPPALIRPRVKLREQHFSLARCKLQPAKTAVSTACPLLRTYHQEIATENGKTSIAARSETDGRFSRLG